MVFMFKLLVLPLLLLLLLLLDWVGFLSVVAKIVKKNLNLLFSCVLLSRMPLLLESLLLGGTLANAETDNPQARRHIEKAQNSARRDCGGRCFMMEALET